MVQVGDTFRSTYADGMFEWTVREVEGKYCLADMDDSYDYGHIEKAFLISDVERSISFQQSERSRHEVETAWWNSLELGSTIHYHNGFGEFVRGTVIERDNVRMLDPVALVGDWTHHWEYHWAKVKRGDGAWRPSAACVFESPLYSSNYTTRFGDPTLLEPLDLSDREADSPCFKSVAART